MKNFSDKMSPKNKTSLMVEFFVDEGDKIWNLKDKDIFDLAITELIKLKLFSKDEVRNFYVFKKKFVYPIYDINYKKNLEKIQSYLNKIQNLHYIGRPGRFKYTNQNHSIEMGLITANNIINLKQQSLDKVGIKKEFIED